MFDRAVWVTRPQPAAAGTAAVVRAAGLTVIEAPLIEIIPTAAPLPKGEPPDWVLLVSANAARGLQSNCAEQGVDLAGCRFAALGQRTAAVARELGWQVHLVPQSERASGLVAALETEQLGGQRVWLPTGNLPGSARAELPAALERMGALLRRFQVYENRQRSLSDAELAQLSATAPGAILLYSPSAVDALFVDAPPRGHASWQRQAIALAIGPVTRARLEEAGADQIIEAEVPSDEGVLRALHSVREKNR